jgi:hypothetical protein
MSWSEYGCPSTSLHTGTAPCCSQLNNTATTNLTGDMDREKALCQDEPTSPEANRCVQTAGTDLVSAWSWAKWRRCLSRQLTAPGLSLGWSRTAKRGQAAERTSQVGQPFKAALQGPSGVTPSCTSGYASCTAELRAALQQSL